MPTRPIRAILRNRSTVLAVLLGCSSPGGMSSESDPRTSGAGGTRSFVPEPGCRSDDDCAGPELVCFRFGQGPGVCRAARSAVATCEVTSGLNECCSSAECSEGQCFEITTTPVECSPTAGFDVRTACVANECESDSDCPGGFCTAAGYAAGRVCIAATCASDDDCSAEPGGVCALLDLGCCLEQVGGGPRRDATIACVYPSDGCQADSDCAGGEYCVVGDRAHCAARCP